MNLICQFCQVKFSSDRRNKKFCCKKCYSLYQSKIKIIPNFLNRKGSEIKNNLSSCIDKLLEYISISEKRLKI
jgi:protein-arginine kinase activator protein McsA